LASSGRAAGEDRQRVAGEAATCRARALFYLQDLSHWAFWVWQMFLPVLGWWHLLYCLKQRSIQALLFFATASVATNRVDANRIPTRSFDTGCS